MALFSPDEEPLLRRGTVRDALLLRIATLKPIRCWAGPGPLLVPADHVEPVSAIYVGVGALQGLPNVTALVNGKADRLEFALANVGPDIAALADSEADDVRSSVCRLGIRLFDEEWAPATQTRWFWRGTADVIRSSWKRNDAGEEEYSIVVSVGTAATGRTRPKHSTWTGPDQFLRSSDDRYCERTPYYGAGVGGIKWPRWG